MTSAAYCKKRNWTFKFLRCIGRFPLKHDYWPGSVLKSVSVPGVLWSAILSALCFFVTQPLVLFIKWLVFNLKLQDLQSSIGMALLAIQELLDYLMYFSWFFLLPSVVRCTEKIVRFDDAYWHLMDGGKWRYLVLLKSFVFWILLSCWVSLAVLVFIAHRWMANMLGNNREQFWIFLLTKNMEITLDLIGALKFYLQIVNCMSYLYYFGIGHALNYRIKLLASHVEAKGLAHYVVKAMQVAPRDKIQRVDLGLWRLREMLMRLTDIYDEFTNATQFVVLIQTVYSTVLGCLMVYYLYINLDYKLPEGSESVLFSGMAYYFFITMVKIFILANCGDALYQNGARLKTVILRCPNISDIDGGTASDFKQMVSTMDFPLSACGYVNINRGTITSIFSVIATYTIVLFQMNPKAPTSKLPN